MTHPLTSPRHGAETPFRHSAGEVFLGPLSLSPEACDGIQSIFDSEAAVAEVTNDRASYRSACDLSFALHDAITEAARHSPDRWRSALGFLPSTDTGCAA